MYKYINRTIILSALFVLFFAACQKLDNLGELETSKHNAEYAIPLFKGKASLQDIFKNLENDSYLTVGDDNVITISYEGEVAAQNSDIVFGSIASFPPFPVDTFMALPFQPPNGVDLDLLSIRSGKIVFAFESNVAETVDLELTIPQATRNGEIFKIQTGVVYNDASLPISVGPIEIDLSGFDIKPTNDSIIIQYTATTTSGERVVMDNFLMLFSNMEYSYAEGYLGNGLIDFEREMLEVDFFNDLTQGNIFFEDPKITLTIDNSFGFPIRIKPKFINVEMKDGSTIPLESNFLEEGINIDYPKLGEQGESKRTQFSFDKNNSNLQEILDGGPVLFDYEMDALQNPDSIIAIRGFMTDESRFTIQLGLELPIYGRAKGFISRDTFDIDFSEYEDVDFAEFNLSTSNGIPLEVAMQLYFADENGLVLDSLFNGAEAILLAAPVDENGEVNGLAEKTTMIPKSADEFKDLKEAKKIFLVASFQTSGEGKVPVKVLSTQNVDLKMGMKIGFNR
ncbi:MAG TPA: hypothetical protein ENK52_04840 [Saprospiraceae bacterium]|nr:hypothetical protein [Saprospiraceae bacterium]